MTVLVASDLDRTLIYSEKARRLGDDGERAVCVEVHEGEPASFMTVAAADRLAELVTRVSFVPVTTRIAEQYRRVTLPGSCPQFAIVANGGVLLVDGAP
ncbi:MAG: HAD family hydrolase, partial [Jatrophihabitantaceae bacterium]